jgi:hypothetical protein
MEIGGQSLTNLPQRACRVIVCPGPSIQEAILQALQPSGSLLGGEVVALVGQVVATSGKSIEGEYGGPGGSGNQPGCDRKVFIVTAAMNGRGRALRVHARFYVLAECGKPPFDTIGIRRGT